MKLRSISYYINEAFIGLLRNRLMSVASIITVASCIFMFAFTFCIVVNLSHILQQVEGSVGLTVYVDDSLDAEQVNELFAQVKALPNVKTIRYISSEEALKRFSQSLDEGDTGILAGLEKDNPLPRSINIDMVDAKEQDTLVAELEALQQKNLGISQIRYQQHIVDTLTSIDNGIRIASIISVGILVIISIVIIINTIRITVNNRKVEINIMKYVGATDWFIRWPFIIEGMLIGIIGAGIPLLVLMAGYNKAIEIIYANVPLLQNIVQFTPSVLVFSTLVPISLSMGVAIGTGGSIASIRRHLQV